MGVTIKLNPDALEVLREINPRMMSYNVEFAEVTGGTFWKAYTPGQIAGTDCRDRGILCGAFLRRHCGYV